MYFYFSLRRSTFKKEWEVSNQTSTARTSIPITSGCGLIMNIVRELTELRKTNAIAESAAEEAALYAKQNTRDELKRELEEQRLQLEKDKDTLLMQVWVYDKCVQYMYVHILYSLIYAHWSMLTVWYVHILGCPISYRHTY